jgi:hypothetical protein
MQHSDGICGSIATQHFVIRNLDDQPLTIKPLTIKHRRSSIGDHDRRRHFRRVFPFPLLAPVKILYLPWSAKKCRSRPVSSNSCDGYFTGRQQMDLGETPHVRFALDRGARPFSGRAFFPG